MFRFKTRKQAGLLSPWIEAQLKTTLVLYTFSEGFIRTKFSSKLTSGIGIKNMNFSLKQPRLSELCHLGAG